METLLSGDVKFRSANEVEVLIVISVCECVSVLVSQLETLLRGDVDFRSTNEVEVLILVSLLNTRAHNLLNGGGCSRTRVYGDASP
jgi:hypothetical protein